MPKITCKHFGQCGGCALLNLSYEEQVAQKRAKLQKTLQDFWTQDIPVTVTDEPRYFRNKVELGFCHQVKWREDYDKKDPANKTRPLEFESTLGFKLKGRWDRAVDITECALFNENLIPLLNAIRAWAQAEKLEYYDQRKHTGVLRHLLVREGKNTGEEIVVLFVTDDFNEKTFVRAVESVLPKANIMAAVNNGLADTAAPESLRVLKGKDFILEKIFLTDVHANLEREVTFKLSPQSFFQTNTKTAQKMYSRVRAVVKKIAPKRIYDLYGGAGSFSLSCADLCEKSICVESVAPAVYNGIENAKINGVSNVQFFCSKVEDFVKQQPIEKKDALIILDPPRGGMHPKAAKAVAESGVENVLYISCNPVTLANDLKILTQHYEILHVEAFDFFPHSEHIETFVQMKLK
ncbi:MAG: 23S rRNA (uracil(1939)-C(5))-methyltransferase RlmD [Elusimicrobia bacterium]|nr:23S rRNA (uracil(1939)-C(5))-methyltransferase RlmD [Elusimicrobiota bacterium]MDD7502570.1 23S rRNA (uracil(1939)-C(5))-methyltransferase RlmD [Elusimicrobiota bacterium]MDY5729038.1 23S rRNA (uracil(1939)-C(5))-methyltransferase RlmD [Elusimicrobiaceae bacterium]